VFVPDSFPLCTTLDGLDLPLTTRQFVADLQQNPDLPLSHFDRIVVYADGSSLSALRHQPPLLLAEKGQADTWAFIVIGEVQASDGTFQRYLIGWQAQPVLYEEQNRAFIGATHAGSDAAEREALFWSMMWRISINDSVSTTFCTDSQLTQAQASGVVGSHQSTESFQLLRGAAQTLAAILPHDKLRIQHVKGHSNDPLNDFVDFAAKAEREKSFYLPRPKFSLCKLRKFIPYPTCGCSFTNKQDFLDFVEMAFTPHLRRCLRLTGRVMKLEMSSHNGDSSRFARVLLRPMFSRSIEGTMVMQEKSNTCDRNLFSID
jgi:ribonuclease HI